MSKNRRRSDAGWATESKLERGPGGRYLCRWCKTEVPKGRRTFCGDLCIHEWKLRSDPGYVRRIVHERDKGVCAHCGMDTDKLARIWRHLFRRACYGDGNLPRNQARRKALMEKYPWAKLNLYHDKVYALWQADHIVPVVEGGGECGLEGYRTLCTPCHKAETKKLRLRLKKTRQEVA